MDSYRLKRWFKTKFGIPVRCHKSGKQLWYFVNIMPEKATDNTLTYKHRFPDALGNLCMSVVYRGSDVLEQQNWGGNIMPYSIAMTALHWLQVMDKMGE